MAAPTCRNVVRSVGMMLDHLGLAKSAQALRNGVAAVLRAGKPRTPDLGGSAKTVEVAEAALKAVS